ncbi:MAG: GH3 auxin-responsive promoter family protein, partial [Chitinophagales bacterium]|nr:GH3 auxin-responsive promoter family protein [Chitinophagales bacterium]
MSLMKVFGSFLAAFEFHRFYREIYRPIENQKKIKKTIIANFKGTQYAQDIEFKDNWQDIPLVDYEAIRPYINDISLGKPNILTRNKIIYFAKTSGTISGVKYIPLSKVTLLNQIKFIRAQLFIYLYKTKKYAILNQKMLFLQGSPKLDVYNKVKYGRLSGIVYHFVPSWLISNRHPSYEVNIIEDWSQKVLAIINSLGQRKLSVIGGIPPWVLGFLEKLQHTTNPFIKEISLYIHGGVSISPFYERLRKFLPNTDFLDTYAASEGLFGLSLEPNEATLTLISHSDIYYEFIEFSKPNAPIIDLRDIKTQVVYEIIISNMSGLYRYRIGDLVE